MHEYAGHADGGAGWDQPGLLRALVCEVEGFVGRDALKAGRDAVAESDSFLDHGGEVCAVL